jgi:DNA (cytosine-5)-methyltransferase 1
VAVTASGEGLGGTVCSGSSDEISLAKSMICATEMEERCVDTYTVISLFSGIGGLDLGVRAAIPTRTICYVEREITCARVLAARTEEGLLDEAPIYADIESFPAERFAGKVDGIISGFPCTPWSVAGKQEGSKDERNMWPDTIRVIREIRPRFAFLENVSALASDRYFGTILGDLAEAGFDAEWSCYTASAVGASHKRERVFILAYSDLARSQRRDFKRDSRGELPAGTSSTELDQLPQFPPGPEDSAWEWIIEHYPELAPARCKLHEIEPSVRNVDDAGKISDRVAALMMLGNAVVPQQAARALEDLWQRACRTG